MISLQVVIMAQGTDRWVLKVLALPVFTDAFSKAIVESPMSNLAFVASMEVTRGAEFVQKVSEMAAAMEPEVAQALLSDPLGLEQFWSVASSVEKLFFESTATQLGFGLCEPSRAHRVLTGTDQLRKSAAIKALVQRPLKAPKLVHSHSAEPSDSVTPLFDQEKAQRNMWAHKLENIGKRAGSSSKLLSENVDNRELTPEESCKLRQMVLTAGAPRTMAAHIRAWEKFELWAASCKIVLYPLTVDKLLKYTLHLDKCECGPSVIPAFKTAVKWVTARLAIDCPDLEDKQLLAIQQEVITNRAKTLKEAVPIPVEVVRCLEKLVLSSREEASRLFVWWWLCMIFASLRFDDAIHVRPRELQMTDDGLFGVAWQTKVDRMRRGTKFVVPKVGFSSQPWLEEGWALLLASDHHDRDYWVHELNSRQEFRQVPPSYQRSLQWLKVLAREALEEFSDRDPMETRPMATVINQLTAHSARVTLLDAAVHARRTTEEIGLQANWKNPGPLVLKYTRNRSSVPALMVQQLVRDLLRSEHPVQETADVLLDDPDGCALDVPQFFIKNPAPGTYYDYKFHCTQLEDPDRVACNKFLLSECSNAGDVLPDLAVLCKACARARPDVVR